MANPEVIKKLIENSAALMEKRAGDIRQAKQNEDQAKQYLDMLTNYRRDYHKEMQRVLRDGVDSMTSTYYRDFLVSLDAAVDQAQKAVQDQSEVLGRHTEAWRQERIKLKTFNTLQDRQSRSASKRERQIEQKANDEFSSRPRAVNPYTTSLGF